MTEASPLDPTTVRGRAPRSAGYDPRTSRPWPATVRRPTRPASLRRSRARRQLHDLAARQGSRRGQRPRQPVVGLLHRPLRGAGRGRRRRRAGRASSSSTPTPCAPGWDERRAAGIAPEVSRRTVPAGLPRLGPGPPRGASRAPAGSPTCSSGWPTSADPTCAPLFAGWRALERPAAGDDLARVAFGAHLMREHRMAVHAVAVRAARHAPAGRDPRRAGRAGQRRLLRLARALPRRDRPGGRPYGRRGPDQPPRRARLRPPRRRRCRHASAPCSPKPSPCPPASDNRRKVTLYPLHSRFRHTHGCGRFSGQGCRGARLSCGAWRRRCRGGAGPWAGCRARERWRR